MKPDGKQTKVTESFVYAFQGIAAAAQGRNFRIQLGIALLAIVLGFIFRITEPEWLAIVVCIGLVLGGECLNTALEAIVDLASPQVHPLAKRAKDAAAGCVLAFSLASLIVALIIFVPRLWGLIFV